jgi:hypothetical protein
MGAGSGFLNDSCGGERIPFPKWQGLRLGVLFVDKI